MSRTRKVLEDVDVLEEMNRPDVNVKIVGKTIVHNHTPCQQSKKKKEDPYHKNQSCFSTPNSAMFTLHQALQKPPIQSLSTQSSRSKTPHQDP